ncbi:hypothetical protein GCM10022198_03230 [Klugiella xanthotipulae]|uniref:Tetratricopeptide repeat protein n=1 Tax=Klugiella xanthotipulae TaxID=244735 RepID=A0A543I752_9MICO|nr:tetratricopeptide repeat protein [Klugiella xanthotipulae]TQM66381.1 hypothetical protein FB466_1221 [Klugiella xanthotipulae]
MSDTPRADILEQIDNLPYGPELRNLIDEAIRQAEESGDNDLAYAARMRLSNLAFNMGDHDTLLSSFAWCLGMHDSDPLRYPYETDGGDLLWQFKWISEALGVNPLFPLEKITEIHGDMERRYREAGLSQSGVLQAKLGVAVPMGYLDEARRLRAERDLIERDDYSHCEACVRREDAGFYRVFGDETEAVRLYDEIFANNFSCGDEPERSEAEVLLPYLRAGRLDDARTAHLRSYRASRSKLDGITIIADHLVFCAVTGNEARGLAMLERHIGRVVGDPLNFLDHFITFTAMAVLLDAVTRAGHGHQPVRGADAPRLHGYLGERDTSWTAAELAAACWVAAESLAEKFNTRNGNTHFSTRLAEARALATEHYEVRIQSESFRAPEPVRATPQSAAEWLSLAHAALFSEDREATQAAVSAGLALAETPTDGGTDPARIATALTHAELWGTQSLLYTRRAEHALAAEAQRSANAVLRAAGFTEYADFRDAVLNENPVGEEAPDDADTRLATLRERVTGARAGGNTQILIRALLDVSGSPQSAAEAAALAVEAETLSAEAVALAARDDSLHLLGVARLHHAEALLALDRIDDAIHEFDAILAEPTKSTFIQLSALFRRSQTATAQNDSATAIARAEDLLNALVTYDVRGGIIQVADYSANLLGNAGRTEEAVQRILYALTQAERAESPRVLELRSALGRHLLYAGHPMEALEQLDAVYRVLDADETAAPFDIASTLYWMGSAAYNSEEYGLGYWAWNRALGLLAEEANGAALLHEVGTSLTTLLLRFRDEAAVEVAEITLASARTTEHPEFIGAALHKLGVAQTQCARAEEALDTLAEAHRIVEQLGAEAWAADILDDTARALGALGRLEEAVSMALRAADAFTQVELLPQAGAAEYYAATRIADTDPEAAIGLFRSACSRFEEGSSNWAAMAVRLADTLESVGRHGEAAEVRAGITPTGDEPTTGE